MHFDSFSLGARHLFQKLVFFMRGYTCDTLLFSKEKSLSEFIKKNYVFPFEIFFFWQFNLEALRA
jgi:hypothetical protein